MRNIDKYLQQYAEDEVKSLAGFPSSYLFNHVSVIPAYKESPHFIERFFSAPFAQQQVLMVLVINQPDVDKNTTAQQKLHDFILAQGEVVWSVECLQLIFIQSTNSAILLVDRFTRPIPIKKGVGLARKIGADIATSLINSGNIKSQWIASTDADASLPDEYFSALESQESIVVATCFNFSHQSTVTKIHQANAIYEKALRYYVAGLHFANSSYAFYTIGSILAFKVSAYANVRGFPKRSAGEDFYLLNKLAKLGQVAFIQDTVILLEARESDRVPFGTGPAVSQIMALTQQQEDYLYYHPQVFSLLRTALTAFVELYQFRQNLSLWYDTLPSEIIEILSQLKFDDFIEKQISANEKQFLQQLRIWFDAFKTLKFIHHARDLYFPNIELMQAIDIAPFKVRPFTTDLPL